MLDLAKLVPIREKRSPAGGAIAVPACNIEDNGTLASDSEWPHLGAAGHIQEYCAGQILNC